MQLKKINTMPDLETATEFHTYKNSFPPDDYRYVTETLFFTTNFNWYLFAYGGPLSKHAQLHLDFISGGIKIYPLTPHQAFNWLTEHSSIHKLKDFWILFDQHSELSQ